MTSREAIASKNKDLSSRGCVQHLILAISPLGKAYIIKIDLFAVKGKSVPSVIHRRESFELPIHKMNDEQHTQLYYARH